MAEVITEKSTKTNHVGSERGLNLGARVFALWIAYYVPVRKEPDLDQMR